MPYQNTPVLQLQIPDTTDTPPTSFVDKLADDQQLSSSLQAIDTWAAAVTGSGFFSMFCPVTGSVLDFNISNGDAGSGFIGGEYNRSIDRIIQEVVGFTSASGSNPAAVIRVDIQIQQGTVQPANFSSIFSNNAFKLAVSGSNQNSPAKTSTFVSGSTMVWPRGTVLRAVADASSGVAAGLGAMRGLTVQVFWKPSGSYGA